MNWKVLLLTAAMIILVAGILFFTFRDTPLKEGTHIISETPEIKDEGGVTPENIISVTAANNRLALDLYRRLREKEGNIFFSPWSISSAMAITLEGARGETEREMRTVLNLPGEERRPAFARFYNEINRKEKRYELDMANAFWAQKDFHFLDSYFDVIKKYYGGNVENLDFIGDTEGSRKTINRWVEGKTKEKIKDLIPQGAIDGQTRLVITNAIYFKGQWIKQFDQKNTQESEFRVTPDKAVKVQMMNLQDAKFKYTEDETVQILELPYAGEELSMLILLPKEDSPDKVESTLVAEKLDEWRVSMKEEQVDVYLPRFKLETKYSLIETFKELGLKQAFDPGQADFSGMTGRRDLFISKIIHQAFVEVNEEGTEAAAATGVVMTLTAMPTKKIFMVDHPFIFIIMDRTTGAIFFLGRVANPAATSPD
jgi:serpin B